MRRSTLRRFLAEDGIDELLELTRLDALASSGDLSAYAFCRRAQAELAAAPALPAPLLRGRDLLALGYPRGPLYGEILTAVQDRQLDGALHTPDEARAWVRSRYPLP
jgi:poly(A) polymerase